MMSALAASFLLSGIVPPELGIPSRIVWMNPEASTSVACEMIAPSRWRCDLPEPPRGVVVMIAEDRLAFESFDDRGATASDGVRLRQWGRVVVLVPAGAPDDLRDVQMTAWKPGRSAVRLHVERFPRIEDSAVDVVRLSDTAAWIAGDATDRNAFIEIDGSTIGSTRVAVAALAQGPPEAPLFVTLGLPFSLTGRVQNSTLQDVVGAEVELFEPLTGAESAGSVTGEFAPMILHAGTRSDGNGRFTFERLVPAPYLVVATDSTFGRGSLRMKSLGEPAIVRLVAPVRAAGRVLRNQLPVAAARVRFVPSRDAFIASTDTRDLIVDESSTDHDGRFVLTLPATPAGAVQVMGADGTSARVPITTRGGGSGDIILGDITLPEPRHLTVRLLDPETCTLFAVGPLGTLGLTIVRATGAGGVHWFDIPEAGEWALDAECEGFSYAVQPLIVVVPQNGSETSTDARIIR